jgi:hypothetical protein
MPRGGLSLSIAAPCFIEGETVECGLVLFDRPEVTQPTTEIKEAKPVCERIARKSAYEELQWIHPIDGQVTLGIIPLSVNSEGTPGISSLKLEIPYHYSGDHASERGDDEPDQTYTFTKPGRNPSTNPKDNTIVGVIRLEGRLRGESHLPPIPLLART